MVFVGGTVLYAAGKIYAHAHSVVPNDRDERAAWMEAAGIENTELCDAAARVELVERLALVGQPWCVEVLRSAQRDEPDPSVRNAIEAALSP